MNQQAMILQTIKDIYLHELDTLQKEIELFETDELLWETRPGIINPSGTLCLHLCGNLNHFVGAVLGNSGYVRNRELEFSQRGLHKIDLVQGVLQTKNTMDKVLSSMDDEMLRRDFPIPFMNRTVSISFLLLTLLKHFSYHLGQLNYLRRIIHD